MVDFYFFSPSPPPSKSKFRQPSFYFYQLLVKTIFVKNIIYSSGFSENWDTTRKILVTLSRNLLTDIWRFYIFSVLYGGGGRGQ